MLIYHIYYEPISFYKLSFFAQHSHHSFVTLYIQKHNVHDSSFLGKNTTTKRLQHTMPYMFNLCDTC